VHNCNPNIFTADVIKAVAQDTTNGARPGAPCTINFAAPHLNTPYVEGWNFSISHAIRNNIVLDVAYVGNHGVRLIGRTDLNQTPSNIPGIAWNALIPGTGATAGKTLGQVCEQTMTVASCQASSLSGSAFAGGGSCFGATCSAKQLYTGSLQAARPFNTKFPYLQSVDIIQNRDVSNYNALQTTLTVRNYHGLSATTGYTWAHALGVGSDNTSGVGSDAYNNNLDYGQGANDLRHRITIAPTYSIPSKKGYGGLLEGWRVNGSFKFQTGRKYTPTDTRDFYGTNKGSRWNFFGDYNDFQTNLAGSNNPGFYPGCPAVGGVASCTTAVTGINPRTGVAFVAADNAPNNPLCSGHASSLATLTAFGCWVQGNSVLTPPDVNQFGNVTQGRFAGPHFWNIDTSVTKTQRVTERFSAEFRGEFFNMLNHPNFSQPGTSVNSCTLTSCTLGVTSNTPNVSSTNVLLATGGPRRIQLGVKLIF
jgi:hypothetical protein